MLLENENTVTLVGGYHTTAGSGWRPLEVELPLTPAAPAKTPVLTDTYGSVSVLLDGDTRTVTIKHTPEIIAWAEDYDIRLDGDVTLPIRNAYNNYVDVCIGELGASFHPVVYLLTEDGFVEYVDVLRCLLYGQSLLCADPIYIANNGTALALRDAEVSLLCADGTETELAPLTAEWNSPQQVDSTGSFTPWGRGELVLAGPEFRRRLPVGYPQQPLFLSGCCHLSGRYPGRHRAGLLSYPRHRKRPGMGCVQRCIKA